MSGSCNYSTVRVEEDSSISFYLDEIKSTKGRKMHLIRARLLSSKHFDYSVFPAYHPSEVRIPIDASSTVLPAVPRKVLIHGRPKAQLLQDSLCRWRHERAPRIFHIGIWCKRRFPQAPGASDENHAFAGESVVVIFCIAFAKFPSQSHCVFDRTVTITAWAIFGNIRQSFSILTFRAIEP